MKIRTQIVWSLICALTLCLANFSQAQETPAALNFKMETLAGKEVELSKYAGKVVLFVNVASKCGLTPQYEKLQSLHEAYGDKGLAIVGVPCNQFGKQEPGSSEEIAEFCEENYGVEFDMLNKVDVNGDDQCDLYKHLTNLDLAPKGKGPVQWNFEKFVVDRTGTPIARFSPRTKPDDDAFMTVIKKAIEGPAAGAPYAYENAKGATYYLFTKDVEMKNSDKVQTIYFFGKEKVNAKGGTPVSEIPEGKVISETKNGLPVLKNKKKKNKKKD